MPRSSLHFSAIALRLETPVPNWRSVMGFCAQIVGKPVMMPEPAARPAAAAPDFRSERRDTPAVMLVGLVIRIPPLLGLLVQESRWPSTIVSPASQWSGTASPILTGLAKKSASLMIAVKSSTPAPDTLSFTE